LKSSDETSATTAIRNILHKHLLNRLLFDDKISYVRHSANIHFLFAHQRTNEAPRLNEIDLMCRQSNEERPAAMQRLSSQRRFRPITEIQILSV